MSAAATAKTWYAVLGLTIGLLALALAWSIRHEAATARALARDHARADTLDTFCEDKRRDLEATARQLAEPMHRDAAMREFDDVFLGDDGQEAMILCLGLPTWDRVSPDGKAFTCSAVHDVACMAAMATAAAAALEGSAAR